MVKLRIMVDMDDTIENLGETWVNYLNERHSLSVKWPEITEWDLKKAFPTLSEWQIYEPLFERGLWERVKPLPDAEKFLKRLVDDGHEVFIATSSHPSTLGMKYELVIKRFFPFLSWTDVICTSRKQVLNADVLIDDGPHNLEGGLYEGILVTAPHNRNYNEKERGFHRADNWKEIYSIVCGIADELEGKWGKI